MRTGLSYMGHHNPRHMETDLKDIKSLGCDDVLLAAQENDFVHMTGKLDYFPGLAQKHGIRPLVIFWGALNCFGGGRSSQFLLEVPQAHQVEKDGTHNPSGCYNNPDCIEYVKGMIDRVATCGFKGYFIDEPSIIKCFCPSCKELFDGMYQGDLHETDAHKEMYFRKKSVVRYVCLISDYVKTKHPDMETLCCMMPSDRQIWEDVALIDSLDNLGTDIYWVNNNKDVKQMRPLIKDLTKLCTQHRKQNHQWLQAWGVKKGKEQRIIDQGNILVDENPDALYVWAYQAQIGTAETCEDPQTAWTAACEILKKAKQI